MEMFYTYILFSFKFEKIYIGQTSDLDARIIYHNEIAINSFTSKFRPWTIIYSEEFGSRSQAMRREKQLKSAKGREFAWQKVLEFQKNLMRGGVRQSADSSSGS